MFPPKNRLFTRGNNYYYRRRIPAFLINYFKPKMFVISLKTSTLSDAKKLAACYDVKFDYLTTQHVMHGLKIDRSKLLEPIIYDKEGQKRLECSPDDLREMQKWTPDQISAQTAAALGTLASPVSDAKLLAALETKAALLKNLDDLCKKYPTITEAFEQFIEHKKGNKSNYRIPPNHKTFIRRFTEIIGDKKVNVITRDDAREVKKVLKKLPKEPASFRKLTVQQILDKYEGNEFLEVRTLNNHIDLYHSLWNFINTDVDKNIVNIFLDLREKETDLKKLKTNEKIKSFTRTDIETIFNTPRFTEKNYHKPQQFWAPLISLFTGARRAEIGQLLIQDIYKNSEDIWVFDFNDEVTPEAPYKKLKNAGSLRKTPIHPFLIDIGFLDFVRSIKHVRLFPELKIWDEDEGYGRNIGDNFNRFIHQIGIDEDKVFHSFRGTFASELERINVTERTRFLLSGRDERISKTTEEKSYLDDRESTFLLSELKKLDFSKELRNVKFLSPDS